MSAEAAGGWAPPERLKEGDGHSSRPREREEDNPTKSLDSEAKTPLMEGWIDTTRAEKQGISDWEVYEASLLLPNNLEMLVRESFPEEKSPAIKGEISRQIDDSVIGGGHGEHSGEDRASHSEQREQANRASQMDREVIRALIIEEMNKRAVAPLLLVMSLLLLAGAIGALANGGLLVALVLFPAPVMSFWLLWRARNKWEQ